MKTDVYSWRVSPELKTRLEQEARRRKISLSAALDLATREWLDKGGAESDGDEQQVQLQTAALKCFGAFASGDAHRSENVRRAVKTRLKRHYDR